MGPDEILIRTLLDERAAAIRAKDVAAALSPWTPEVVNYDLAPPLQYVGVETRDPKAREIGSTAGKARSVTTFTISASRRERTWRTAMASST